MILCQQSNSPLVDLWQRYSAYKLWNGKGNSSNYKAIEFRLKRLNDNSTTQATIDGLFDKYSAHAFLETFRGLYSCCKWGKESKLIKVNPLEWLHLQIAPIQRDKLNLIKLNGGGYRIRHLESVASKAYGSRNSKITHRGKQLGC